MAIPYTREALEALRHAAASNTPAAEIQQYLGWDTATIARRCKDHGIDLLIPLATAMGAHDDVPPPAPAALDLILSKLTPRQAQIFSVLQPHADGEWFSAAKIAKRLGGDMTRKKVRVGIAGLDRRLDRMDADYQVETRMGAGGGFRLVTDETKR